MRINNLRTLFVLACLSLLPFLGIAQSNCSYVVVNAGTYTQHQIDQAFGAARLDSYRKRTIRRSMFFVNGAEIQLLSALEMTTSGCPVNQLEAMEDSAPLDPNRKFEIHPAGVIFESVAKVTKE